MVVDEKKVIELYNKGLSYTAIAAELGCANSTMSSLIQRLMERGTIISRIERIIDSDKVKALYEAGWSASEIACDMSESESDINDVILALKASGEIRRRPKQQITTDDYMYRKKTDLL